MNDQNSYEGLREKVNFIAESLLEIKDSVKKLEKESREIDSCLNKLDNKICNLEENKNNNKEKWNIALSFIVQLIWVILAGYVLTRLGINMGPL